MIHSLIKRLRSPSGILLAGRAVQFGTQLGLVLLAPKVLSHDEFVQYNLVTPVGFLLASLIFGWLSAAICRYAFDFLAEGSVAQREMTASYFALVGIACLIIYIFATSLTTNVYALVPIVIISSAVKVAALGVSNSGSQQRAYLGINLLYILPPAIFLLLSYFRVIADFRIVLSIFLFADLVAGLAIVALCRIRFWRLHALNWHQLRAYWTYGAPLILNGVANWLLTVSDRYFLSFWTDTAHTANYILSYQLAGSIIQHPMSFFLAVFGPKVLQLEQTGGRSAALKYVYASLHAFLPRTPLYLFAATAFVLGLKTVFYGEYQLEAALVVIIIGAHLVNSIGYFYSKEFELTGRTDVITRAIFLGAGANVLSNLILIPICGILGAAISTMIGYSVYVLEMFRCRQGPEAHKT